MTDKEEVFHGERHLKIGGLLKEAVFGFNDGLVSTFAVIAGLTGGATEQKTVLLGALATLFAGAFSMGLGTYLGSKSEKEHYENELRREQYEMEFMPEIERQEIRDIYAAKGFKGKLLEEVVTQITGDKEVWLKTMMTEELGFAELPPNPRRNGLVMSVAFFVGASIPTLPYILPFSALSAPVPALANLPFMFFFSLSFSIAGLLLAGALKTRFTKKNILLSAFETLAVGAVAAAGSYSIGLLFSLISTDQVGLL